LGPYQDREGKNGKQNNIPGIAFLLHIGFSTIRFGRAHEFNSLCYQFGTEIRSESDSSVFHSIFLVVHFSLDRARTGAWLACSFDLTLLTVSVAYAPQGLGVSTRNTSNQEENGE
jgi:hypothetical protein